MRLARLVVAGLVLGALAGFVSALLKPRDVIDASPADPVDGGPARGGPTGTAAVVDPAVRVPGAGHRHLRPGHRPPGRQAAVRHTPTAPDDRDPADDDESEPVLTGCGGTR